jgi:hypothetical protein
MTQRGILTLAFGGDRYIEMAKTLGRSLRLHAPHIPVALVTDSLDTELKTLFTQLVPLESGFGTNVRQKLHLDSYSPFNETLYIDSDCIVVGDLESIWSAFHGQDFAVAGRQLLKKGETDPFLDVNFILDAFRLSELPKFNGGIYYFTNSPRALQLFSEARRLLANSRDLRFREFRQDGPNDEAIFSVAMALNGLRPIPIDEGGMWTPIGAKGHIHLDVLRGSCRFIKYGKVVQPEIIHFAGRWAFCFEYRKAAEQLRLLQLQSTMLRMETVSLYLRCAPERIIVKLKEQLVILRDRLPSARRALYKRPQHP